MKAHRNREPSDQVRVELDQGATLLVAAQHHLEGPPKFVDCLQRAPQQIQAEELHQAKDEVTRACPDQLRGTAARAGSEIFLLKQGNLKDSSIRLTHLRSSETIEERQLLFESHDEY